MKALITGVTGQDGYYLSELCKAKGIEPIGVSRTGDGLHANLADYGEVERLISSSLPDFVFHLAANSTTRHEALFENHETISTGTLNILEAVRKRGPGARVFITGSGVQFVNKGLAVSEHAEFEASSPYAVSRIQSVYAARYYRSMGIKAYVGYLFHHESPLRKPGHVSQMIAQLVKRVAGGSRETLELGDISVQKEWTFAVDTVKGIFTLVNQDGVFEATIGSGVTYSIQDWLDQCFGIIGRKWQEYVRMREGFKAEYQKLQSDPATINSLGWFPEMSFGQLAELMVGKP